MEELQRLLDFEIDLDRALRVFALIIARMAAFVATVPFLGGPLIPGRLKFGVALILSAFLFPFLEPQVLPSELPKERLLFALCTIKEVFIGVSLGYVVSLSFRGVEAAGQFMDLARGTTFVQVIAPFTGGQTSMLGQLYLLLYTVIFFTLNAHLVIIHAFYQSFKIMPVTAFPGLGPGEPFALEMIILSARVFLIGLTIGAPLVIAALLVDVMLGVVNRTAPNIQVFWLGQPIKAVGGLFIIFVALEFSVRLLNDEAAFSIAELTRASQLLVPPPP